MGEGAEVTVTEDHKWFLLLVEGICYGSLTVVVFYLAFLFLCGASCTWVYCVQSCEIK